LRTTLRILLNTNHPMFIWWGEGLIQFYNDAYRQTMGPERHPSALGQGGRECWAEIWDIIGPQIEQVMSGGGATWHENQLVPVTRHGRLEQVYWTYGYSPIDEDDRVGGVQTADIHAVVSYAIDHHCGERPEGYGTFDAFVSRTTFAPFALANGTLSNDRSTEKSALQFGFDSRATVYSGPLFNYQIFTLSPYYQTDFRGEASAYGASASWEPYKLDWRLGGNVYPATPWLDYYWQLKAEVDSLHVNKAGLTDFTNGTDYAFWGGTVKLLLFPFPDQLQRRVIAIAEYSYYWESQAQQDVRLFVGTLAYNITEDGSTSISGQYKKGTEKQTLKQLDQYLLSFNYKY